MGIGLTVGWVGYTLIYFGFCSIRGPGVGLLDLVIPGRTVVIPGGGTGSGKIPWNAPGGGAGGSTVPPGTGVGQDPGGPGVTPGPGDNQPQPGGVIA